MALRRSRCTCEFNTKLNFVSPSNIFWYDKDFGVARNGAAEGFKTPDGHIYIYRMGNDALTNSPMSSRYVPNLKISIIVCPSCVKIG